METDPQFPPDRGASFRSRHFWLTAAVGLACLPGSAARGSDWPQFRGPGGQGHTDQTGLPLTWSETEHVLWKVPVPGLGWSSPVVGSDRVWLTTAVDEGRLLRAVCLDAETGRLVHDVEVFRNAQPLPIHAKNSHASPTPILEGDLVWVHFGTYGTACLSNAGDVLWKSNDLIYAHGHGPAGSPVLYGDLLIVSCDGTDRQFVAAFNKHDGEIVWNHPRQGRMAYSTPLVISPGGRDLVVSTCGDHVGAYDPRSGEEIWRCRYDGYSLVPRPVYGHGMVFISSGYDDPVLYAIRADGSGDVTNTHVAWTLHRGAPHNPSPVLVGDELYVVSDRGIVVCLDAVTGAEHWRERLAGTFSASPLYGEGRIYFTDEDGLTTVIAARREFEVLAANQIAGRTLASLAVSGKALFMRSDTHLYKIADSTGAP